MNLFKYLTRQLKRLKIDLLTQGTFLAGGVPSIDDKNIIKTVSTNYEELEIIFFGRYNINPNDVIADVGCGKGRVFSYLLYKGIKNRMIGYEINPNVGDNTAKRLSKYSNVEIKVENIFDDFPDNCNVFYLYNPFKEEMISAFANEIVKIAHLNPVILYNNTVHLGIFDEARFIVEAHNIPVPHYGYSFPFAIIRVK